MRRIRIGSGAGYSGDRIEPAVELAEKGDIKYLIFECLAERTIAIDQQQRMKDPEKGYDPLLVERMEKVLPVCHEKGIKIITNMGAANPLGGMKKAVEVARNLKIEGFKVAAVAGDDVLSIIRQGDYVVSEDGRQVRDLDERLVSANAYLGADSIVSALKNGADLIITGRVADPSLFLAPLIYEFEWGVESWDTLGKGIVIGHLLECAGQVTGGYFADPGYKDVPDLSRLGFPIAEVSEDGTALITKVPGSGGMVTTSTCKEQLLYEIHDPSSYITPDVVADFSGVMLKQVGKDEVSVQGGRGRPKTDTLKVCVGYIDSYIGEGQISYAGPGAVTRAKLARDIVLERLQLTGVQCEEVRADLIGMDALHGSSLSRTPHDPYEVRLRVAGRTSKMQEAIRVGNEVETLYTNGPAGGGGVMKAAREVIAMVSTLIPRTLATPEIRYEVL
ncbi:MAG: acyclic terpene utilization AtuA family protein [Desulfomonilaceae bacterium]